MTLNQFHKQFADEDAPRAWFERARRTARCARGSRPCRSCVLGFDTRVWCCGRCKSQFTVTAGTPMHRTHLLLLTWLQAMWLISASSKGISAMKMAEWLGVAYQTAWHLGHRIRAMMAEDNPVLRGIVELDEIYAGAPPQQAGEARPRPYGRPGACGQHQGAWHQAPAGAGGCRARWQGRCPCHPTHGKPRLPRRYKESWQRTPW